MGLMRQQQGMASARLKLKTLNDNPYNSEAYWGRQYYEVYSSPYLTDKEREKISRDVHTIAILPNEFDKDPKRVKEQIKKNRGILKERKKEAKKDKG